MFKINDSSDSTSLMFDNAAQVTTSMNKCAIIFHDEPLNQYIFVCYHCGETFPNANNIIDHLNETHFYSNQSLLSNNSNKNEFDIKDELVDLNIEITQRRTNTADVDRLCKTELKVSSDDEIETKKSSQNTLTNDDIEETELNLSSKNVQDLPDVLYLNDDNTSTDNNNIKKKRRRRKVNATKDNTDDNNTDPIPKQAPYICYICKKTLSTRESLIFHLGLLHNRKNLPRTMYQCQLCDNTKSYASKYKYENHLREHANLREFKCDVCHLGYNTIHSLKTHMTMHNKREFQCDHCAYISKTKYNLTAHIRNVHMKQKTFKCPICDKIFNYKNSYIYHQRHHTGERPYQCYLCGVVYSTSSKLSKHMKGTHSTQSHKCQQCVKEFASESRLRTHMKTHTDQRLHTCTICGNSFKSRKTLRQHIYIHDEVKRFKCNYCDMKFAQTAGRRGHERLKHLSL